LKAVAKEILVNAGDLESRVAILVDGELTELHLEREQRIVGNIYRSRVANVLPGMDAAFADIGLERNAFLSVNDIAYERDEDGGDGRDKQGRVSIENLVKVGQQVLVQVTRAPMGTKGARVTTRLALPGRYLVLLLTDGAYIGVSRKIETERERKRLRGIAEKIRPKDRSLIVRTEAEGKTRKELAQDLDVLVSLAERIEAKAKSVSAPALIHEDLALVHKLVRDAFTRDVKSLLIDSEPVYQNVLELVEQVAPSLKSRVSLYTDPMPLFHAYNLEAEIDRLLRPRIWLRSGGYINIDQTEALTVIDVNTGRYTGTTQLAETILNNNLQAAEEIARQLRLRDIGGIIVVDFIDMDRARHRSKLLETFEEALKRDRARTKVGPVSPLGLVELTRKRTGEPLTEITSEACPTCGGQGRVRSAMTQSMKVEREVARLIAESHPDSVLVRVPPKAAAILVGFEGERARGIEERLATPIHIRAGAALTAEQFEVVAIASSEIGKRVALPLPGQVLEAEVMPANPMVTPDLLASVDGYLVSVKGDLSGGAPAPGKRITIRLENVGRSFGTAVIYRPRQQPAPQPPPEKEKKKEQQPQRARPRGAGSGARGRGSRSASRRGRGSRSRSKKTDTKPAE
jgi:ribonuclease G